MAVGPSGWSHSRAAALAASCRGCSTTPARRKFCIWSCGQPARDALRHHIVPCASCRRRQCGRGLDRFDFDDPTVGIATMAAASAHRSSPARPRPRSRIAAILASRLAPPVSVPARDDSRPSLLASSSIRAMSSRFATPCSRFIVHRSMRFARQGDQLAPCICHSVLAVLLLPLGPLGGLRPRQRLGGFALDVGQVGAVGRHPRRPVELAVTTSPSAACSCPACRHAPPATAAAPGSR